MCQFFSALVLRNGDLRHHPMLDSHSDLVQYFGLRDDRLGHDHFAKIELTPGDDWLDPATYRFRLDEETTPAWWNEVAVDAEAACRRVVERMIIRTGERRLIVDGCWIVGGDATLTDVRGGRLMRVQDSASIQHVWGSASIRDVWGSASIRGVGDSASIQNVGGSASIRDVGGSASIQHVGGSDVKIYDVADLRRARFDASAKKAVVRKRRR